MIIETPPPPPSFLGPKRNFSKLDVLRTCLFYPFYTVVILVHLPAVPEC